MAETIFDRLKNLLEQRGVVFHVSRHEPVYTSQQAAAVRGTALASGAKALICKASGEFVMFVMPADRRLASKKVRQVFRLKNIRFADREEVEQLTGLTPGAIPPFGSLFDMMTYCDELLSEQHQINFNAGDHSISVSMAFDDYVAVERPRLGQFADLE